MSHLWLGYNLNFKTIALPFTTRSKTSIKYYLQKCFHISSQNGCTQQSLEEEKHKPFLDVLAARRLEAKRSILVQVQSSNSYKDLYSYCSLIGSVQEMFHYKTGLEPMHFIIVEFKNESDVKNVLSISSHVDENQIIPVHSSFLWFRATSKKLQNNKELLKCLSAEDATTPFTNAEILSKLKKADDLSDQMQTLYKLTKLNDVGTRLRFLTAKQVEESLTGMFPNANALPFGSSVNGCGKMGCDLDLVLRLNEIKKTVEPSRLVYHCKATSGSERSVSQRHMEAIGDLLQLFLPGCSQVRRILQARVPIIKYYQQLTDIECDLSMGNMSGVHMSDFLYIMGSLDERVRPLIFAVRKWASDVGLTNSSPGRWITNFSLTLLVLAFLQKPFDEPPILPTLDTLIKHAGKDDKFITEDGINCTFLRDYRKLDHKTTNNQPLSTLLKQFFEFYAQFDFSDSAISLNEGKAIRKPEHSALYIVNPLEKGLNVAKNVSLEELHRFKDEVRNAAWILESEEGAGGDWGLLAICKCKKKAEFPIGYLAGGKEGKSRLVNVSDIFEEEEEALNSKKLSGVKGVDVRVKARRVKKRGGGEEEEEEEEEEEDLDSKKLGVYVRDKGRREKSKR